MGNRFGRQVPGGADPALGPSPLGGSPLQNPFAGTPTGKGSMKGGPGAPKPPRPPRAPKVGGGGSKGGSGSGKSGAGSGKPSFGKPSGGGRAPRGANNYPSF